MEEGRKKRNRKKTRGETSVGKNAFVTRIFSELGTELKLRHYMVDDIFTCFIDAIECAMLNGQSVQLPRFGTFRPFDLCSRTVAGVDLNGDPCTSIRYWGLFKPSLELIKKVNNKYGTVYEQYFDISDDSR